MQHSELNKFVRGVIKTDSVKRAIVLFFAGLLIFSDVFNNLILESAGLLNEFSEPSTKGTILQLTLLVMVLLIYDSN